MTERTPQYNRFWRSAVWPFWVFNPLVYRTRGGFGIYSFALNGEVGKFNLAWLTFPQSADPTDVRAYQQAPLKWAFVVAPSVMVNGRTLLEHASFNTLPEFRDLMVSKRSVVEPQITGAEMTWDRFMLLMQRESISSE